MKVSSASSSSIAAKGGAQSYTSSLSEYAKAGNTTTASARAARRRAGKGGKGGDRGPISVVAMLREKRASIQAVDTPAFIRSVPVAGEESAGGFGGVIAEEEEERGEEEGGGEESEEGEEEGEEEEEDTFDVMMGEGAMGIAPIDVMRRATMLHTMSGIWGPEGTPEAMEAVGAGLMESDTSSEEDENANAWHSWEGPHGDNNNNGGSVLGGGGEGAKGRREGR